MNHYKLIIIGGGSSGFAAAQKADELGIKTLLINAGLPLAGTCLNVGCIPSKQLLYAGELLHTCRNTIDGVVLDVEKFDFNKVIKFTNKVIKKFRAGNYAILDNLEHVTYLKGWAHFVSSHEVEVGSMRYSADYFLIATGSTALASNIENITQTGFMTHVEALNPKKQPKSLIIIGAGPLGLEFAQMYARFGTQVTLLEQNDSIFAQGEPELTTQLEKLLVKEGIVIKTGVTILSVKKTGVKKIISFLHNAKHKEVSADEILIATGKTPNTNSLKLYNAGVAVDKKKAITVTKYLQTSKQHIYAAGDVINMPQRIETTAAQEGRFAVENMFQRANQYIDYATVPYALFTDPQLAYVGLQEHQVTKDEYQSVIASFKDVTKAKLINRTEGLIKIIIHKKTNEIKGVHILSPHAADIIAQAMILVQNNYTVADIHTMLPVFPTLSQIIKKSMP